MKRYPFVSVIIVNYNGAHYLPACLDAIRCQSYPSRSFEVVVFDNGSTDGSIELLRQHYSWVRVLAHPTNLGFASGNNRAIQATSGAYAALLNNDTVPSTDWLERLIDVAESDPSIGLVAGRSRLYYNQLLVTLQSGTFSLQNEQRILGVQLYAIDSNTPGGVVQYLEGVYGWEIAHTGQRFRWTKTRATIGVPVPPGAGDWPLSLMLAASRSAHVTTKLQVLVGERLIEELTVTGHDPVLYRIMMPAEIRCTAEPLVQNAGTYIFQDGSGRDRGTYVQDSEMLYEIDRGQYNQIEEVFAGCGANLLIRRAMLDDTGLFDDDFFMYYEDVDLSWRARSRGWKVLYAPDAIVRHIHCGTAKEWSPFFTYHVDRNRLAMHMKNSTYAQVLGSWGHYLAETGLVSFKCLATTVLQRSQRRAYARQFASQSRVLYSLLKNLPTLLYKRHRIQQMRRVQPAALETWFKKE